MTDCRQTESFSLTEIVAMPTRHDLSPEEIPIAFVGRVSEAIQRRRDEMREAQRVPSKEARTLNRLADYIEGWRQTILAEWRDR